MNGFPVYLDCNATTPLEPEVRDAIVTYLCTGLGNPSSRSHMFGQRAREAVEAARLSVASLVEADPDEVIFTSGATESNNIAIMGLADFGRLEGRRHIVSSQIEHRAVLEPLRVLEQRGFEIALVKPTAGGWVEAESIAAAVRADTLLVSVMHANSETGVLQPLDEICRLLQSTDCLLHVDAAQGYGKDLAPLRNPRIDLISVTSHKIYGPSGVGALIARHLDRMPISPIMYGGGQENGLRPGTLPVPLIAGFGVAAHLASVQHDARQRRNLAIRAELMDAFAPLGPTINGSAERSLPHVLNLSFEGIQAEKLISALEDLISVSSGSACSSGANRLSHVLAAMGVGRTRIREAVRISWCHLTPSLDWRLVGARIEALRRR